MQRFVAIAILVLTSAIATARAADIVDGVAAVVNDRVITYSEVRDYVQPVVQQLRRNYSGQELIDKIRAAQQDALNNLIERALILDEFKTKGYSIPETVIDDQFNDVIDKDYSGDRAAFIKTLQAQNVTVAQYREQLRDRIIVQAMRNRKTQQYVVASPYKIEKYYEENIDQFKVGDQIKLRMIFVKKGTPQPEPATATVAPPSESAVQTNETSQPAEPATNAVVPDATSTNATAAEAVPPPPAPVPLVDPQRKLAEDILGKLDEGQSFDSLARVYSEGKEGKEGGDWGWIGRDVLRKELSDVAFALKEGEHSRLVETDDGYYILQVDDVKATHVKPLAEVRDEIEKTLLQQQRAKMQDEWVKDLRAKAYIRQF